MEQTISKSKVKKLLEASTHDYQNRNYGNIAVGIPDRLEIDKDFADGGFKQVLYIVGVFKNTRESVAIAWMEKYMKNEHDVEIKFDACQVGEYQDDWVEAGVRLEIVNQ